MWANRGALVAWSAGVSAAAAALAVLFVPGKSVLDQVLHWGFAVVGIAAFVMLLGAAVRLPAGPARAALIEGARALAVSRAEQVRHVDQMPVRWEVTPVARAAMPSGLVGADADIGAFREFAGEFSDAGSRFEHLPLRRIVFLGEAGSGKTTLVGKLFDDLLKTEAGLGVPISVPAAQWGAGEDIGAWLAARFKVAGKRVSDALAGREILIVVEDLDELPPILRARAIDWINSLEPDVPLVVTSRKAEYVSLAPGFEPRLLRDRPLRVE